MDLKRQLKSLIRFLQQHWVKIAVVVLLVVYTLWRSNIKMIGGSKKSNLRYTSDTTSVGEALLLPDPVPVTQYKLESVETGIFNVSDRSGTDIKDIITAIKNNTPNASGAYGSMRIVCEDAQKPIAEYDIMSVAFLPNETQATQVKLGLKNTKVIMSNMHGCTTDYFVFDTTPSSQSSATTTNKGTFAIVPPTSGASTSGATSGTTTGTSGATSGTTSGATSGATSGTTTGTSGASTTGITLGTSGTNINISPDALNTAKALAQQALSAVNSGVLPAK